MDPSVARITLAHYCQGDLRMSEQGSSLIVDTIFSIIEQQGKPVSLNDLVDCMQFAKDQYLAMNPQIAEEQKNNQNNSEKEEQNISQNPVPVPEEANPLIDPEDEKPTSEPMPISEEQKQELAPKENEPSPVSQHQEPSSEEQKSEQPP